MGSRVWNLLEKVVYAVLKMLFRIGEKEISDEFFISFMQFIKFGIVGISNTIISYALYVAGLFVFQRTRIFPKVDYLIAQGIAFILSVLWSFYWNNKKVFILDEGEERSIWKALLKTYVSYSFTGLLLNSILLVLWVQVMHISEFVAPIINLLVSVPMNFLINKFWAFRKDRN